MSSSGVWVTLTTLTPLPDAKGPSVPSSKSMSLAETREADRPTIAQAASRRPVLRASNIVLSFPSALTLRDASRLSLPRRPGSGGSSPASAAIHGSNADSEPVGEDRAMLLHNLQD